MIESLCERNTVQYVVCKNNVDIIMIKYEIDIYTYKYIIVFVFCIKL